MQILLESTWRFEAYEQVSNIDQMLTYCGVEC